jgi:hypothetical protein
MNDGGLIKITTRRKTTTAKGLEPIFFAYTYDAEERQSQTK